MGLLFQILKLSLWKIYKIQILRDLDVFENECEIC